MYTNPKMKYKGNLSRNKQRWTKTLRGKRLLMKGYTRFQSKPKASNLSTMTMFVKKTMNSSNSMVCFM